ncbi:MAG: hypothetical protein MI784_07765 [Cytophagales bacterium]|nr:hypothetical protein [Cytophagales bacterium]
MKSTNQKVNVLVFVLSLIGVFFLSSQLAAQPTDKQKKKVKKTEQTCNTEEAKADSLMLDLASELDMEEKYFVLNDNLEVVFEGSQKEFQKKYNSQSVDLLLKTDNEHYYVL